MDKGTPLGIVLFRDEEAGTTQVSWSYLEESEAEYFELQYFDEEERKWKPYDGRNGLIRRR